MADPFLGEIRMFGGTFAPRNWAFCNGQLLAISEYDALYSLIGTTYGGDGRTNFALPDMRGRIPVSMGQFPGSQHNYPLGQRAGSEEVTLTIDNMPAHTHSVMGNDSSGDAQGPTQAVFGPTTGSDPDLFVYGEPSELKGLNQSVLEKAGGSAPVSNMQPYLCINFIMALLGTYPPRS